MLILALGFGAALVASQSPTTYGQPPYLQVRYPGGATGVAAGDLDGDGDGDLALAAGDVVRLMWTSGGLWVERTETLAVEADCIVAVDLDLDGDLDLVTTGTDALNLLVGDGQGGFAAPVMVPMGHALGDLATADLDLDQVPDLVVLVGTSSPHAAVLLGDGQGGFVPGTPVRLPSGGSLVALGDLDEDGRVDLVVDPGQQVFLGDGQGGFQPAVGLGMLQGSSSGLALADVDGDGHLDVAASWWSDVAVAFGDGQGGFPQQARGLVPGTGVASGLVAFDLDGDGGAELVSKDWFDFRADVFRGDGGRTLTWIGAVEAGDSPHGNRELLLSDLDGDGALELVSCNRGDVALVRGDGAGWFVKAPTLSDYGGYCVGLGDLDGDGHQDLVSGYSGPEAYLGDGQGGFGPAVVSGGPYAGTLALGDVNQDGALDLVAAHYNFVEKFPPYPPQHAEVHLGDGHGGFASVRRLAYGGELTCPSLADLDGDGGLDVVLGTSWGLGAYLGDGSGGFVKVAVPGPTWSVWATAVGDVDLDGDVDLLAATSWGEVALYRGNGSAGFDPPERVPIDPGGLSMPHVTCLALADFDLDGALDLAVGHYVHAVSLLWGEPGGGFGPPQLVEGALWLEHPRDLEVADVDCDGRPDLVVACEGNSHFDSDGGLAVLRGLGGRELEHAWVFGHGRGVVSVEVGDLDGDGRPDLVTSSVSIGYYDAGGGRAGPEVHHPLTVFLNQLPADPACTVEATYCVAKLNSAGCLPRVCSDGAPTLSGPDDFVVRAEDVLSHQPGLLLWGLAPATTPFHGATLCVALPLVRSSLQGSGGAPGSNDCSGAYALPFTQATMALHGLQPGTQVFAQFWSRDPYLPSPFAFGLTNALRFTIQP